MYSQYIVKCNIVLLIPDKTTSLKLYEKSRINVYFIWAETKTIKTISKLKCLTEALCYHPTPLTQLPIRVAILVEGKGISPSPQKTLIWLTHKRPSDHKRSDPVGPLCLVCMYMYTWSLWGFLTLLPFPLRLSFIPSPSSSSSASSFSSSSSAARCFETSECRHVQSFGGPRGPRSRQRERNKETPQCPRYKSYLTITIGEKLLNITKRLDRQRRSEECLVCCSHNHTVS